jgi:flagellar biosynthetic protein FliQ
MNSDFALQLSAQLLWNAALIASPVLGVTLLVGLLISVLQAVTQIQEMSLSFVPKLLAAVIVIVVFGPWMLKRLLTFSSALIENIPSWI